MSIHFDQSRIQFLADNLDIDDFISLLDSTPSHEVDLLQKMDIKLNYKHLRDSQDKNALLSFMVKFNFRTSCPMINHILFNDAWTPPKQYDFQALIDLFSLGYIVFQNSHSVFQIVFDIFSQEINHQHLYDNESLRLLTSYIVSDCADGQNDLFIRLLDAGISFDFEDFEISVYPMSRIIKKSPDFLNLYSLQIKYLLRGLTFDTLRNDPFFLENLNIYYSHFSIDSRQSCLEWLAQSCDELTIRKFLFNEISVIHGDQLIKETFPKLYDEISKLCDVYLSIDPYANDETLYSYIKTQDQINGILLKNMEIELP